MKAMNSPGQSPCFVSEYYTGWMTHSGEAVSNTTTTELSNALGEWLGTGAHRPVRGLGNNTTNERAIGLTNDAPTVL